MLSSLNRLLAHYSKANPPPPSPRRELLVFGIKRCGNHAIIEHLLGHLRPALPIEAMEHPRRYRIHLNNIKELQPKFLPNPLYGDTQIMSWENRHEILHNPDCLRPRLAERPHVDQRPIVVLRDPYNWFASLRRKRREWNNLKEGYLALWIAYARHFFIDKVDGVFPCNFNLWFADKDYRVELSRFIGEPPTDDGVDRVRSIGSSFDGRKFDGRAREMRVLERWKSLTGDEWAMLERYPEIADLSRAIFDFAPRRPR